MEIKKISWDHLRWLITIIEGEYHNKNIQKIIGISRGGLTPAVMLSNRLKVPMIPLEWQTRDGSFRDISKLIRIANENDMSKVLFIDDICDSGLTIAEINKCLPESRWCTLFSKKSNVVEFCPSVIDKDLAWIEFPWE